MLLAWTIDNGTSNWSEGLRFVQLLKNSSPDRNLQNKTPYEVLFGEKPRLGLQKTFLPKEVADVLTTEEELESAIREMTGAEDVDDEAMAVPEMTGPEGITDEVMAIPELTGAAEPVAQDVMAVDKEDVAVSADLETGDEESAQSDCSQADPRSQEEENDNTSDDPTVAEHMKKLRACRAEASLGQETSSAQMLSSSNAKQPSLNVGDCVLLPVSEFDRGRLDARNIPGVVSKITEHGAYRIATKHGVVKTAYSRNQLQKADCQILKLQDTNPAVSSFRKIATKHSAHGGQGYAKCACQTSCSSKRCACRKSGTLCHSHCHPKNSKCKNK
ncbi:hypothetical protein V1264_011536 [Littorina saxatilis]|uniref:Uncharacterized protein n=1 Tax=Littorina saxatilis TaxID=31220 RepID=A0AAN9BT26_9CAEN